MIWIWRENLHFAGSSGRRINRRPSCSILVAIRIVIIIPTHPPHPTNTPHISRNAACFSDRNRYNCDLQDLGIANCLCLFPRPVIFPYFADLLLPRLCVLRRLLSLLSLFRLRRLFFLRANCRFLALYDFIQTF